ncbi:hypothetical protein D3C75_1131350 [compost metagenome]
MKESLQLLLAAGFPVHQGKHGGTRTRQGDPQSAVFGGIPENIRHARHQSGPVRLMQRILHGMADHIQPSGA